MPRINIYNSTVKMSTIIQKYNSYYIFPPVTYGWTVHQCSFHAIIALFILSFAIFKKIHNTALLR